MSQLPGSSFSAGAALDRGRELSAEEERLFRRRRRVSLVALSGLVLGVPVVVYMMAWGATQPDVDKRIRTYPSGATHVEAEFIGGARHGSFAEYHLNGQVKALGAYWHDREDGPWEYFNWNGVRTAEGSWARGVYDGRWRHYHSDGSLKGEFNYTRGVRDGTWRQYYEGGQLEAEQQYKDGYVHGEERAYFANGQLASVVQFRHGLEHGPVVYWHDNGEKAAEGVLISGRKHGLWRTFADTGDVLRSERYDMGFVVTDEKEPFVVTVDPTEEAG